MMIDGVFKKLSAVQIMVSVTSSVSMIVDSIIISRFLGMNAVAAAGLITPVLMFILAFSGVLSSGGQLTVGQKLGRGKIDEANKSLSLNVALVLLSSAVIIILTFVFSNQICVFLGAEKDSLLFFEAKKYLRGYILGTPGIIGMLSLIPIMNIDGDKKRTSMSAMSATIGDILLDLICVVVFPGNIFAIGLASSISYYIAFGVILGHFFVKNDKHVLKISFKNLAWKEAFQTLYLGSPAALQKVLRTLLSFTVNQILIAAGGAMALAAFTIISNIGNLINSVGQGMSAATLTMTGVMYGERIKKNLSDLYKAFIKYSILWNLIMAVFVLVSADYLVVLFMTSKGADVSTVALGLRIFSIDFVFYSLCLCAKSYYQGIKRMKVNYIITVFEGYICIAFFTWLFGRFFGLNGVCLGYGIGDAVSILSIIFGIIITNKRLPHSMSDALLLQDGYAIPEDSTFHSSVTNIDDAIEVSKKAYEFVEQYKDGNTALSGGVKVSLAVEEFTKNIIQYGFTKVKDPQIDVFMYIENGRVVLQIKDNCEKFSPVDYMRSHAGDSEMTKYNGIPLMFGLAKDIEYYSVLGMNKLVIEI